MNKVSTLLVAILFAAPVFSQIEEVEEVVQEEQIEVIEEAEAAEEGNIIITENQITIVEEGEGLPDTTTMNIGNKEVIIITHNEEDFDLDFDEEDEEAPRKKRKSDAHWAGVDFGFTMLLNENMKNSFSDHPYWNTDPARSHVWNLNLLEHKFNFGTPHVGLTTGLGFSFTSVAFKNDYLITSTADSLYAVMDTVNTYSKNKLKASYLTIPLLLEFNTSSDSDRSFYLAAGVVGGVRMTSKLKRNGEFEGGKTFEERLKGTYSLNPFKLDGVIRLGYSDFGVFANYSLLPLFDLDKTVEVYPLTFGLSVNF